jgi:hypothetical protein
MVTSNYQSSFEEREQNYQIFTGCTIYNATQQSHTVVQR